MKHPFWPLLGWVLGACVLGFAVSAFFAGWMKLSRRLFLIPYVSLAGIFLYVFIVQNQVDVTAILKENWVWGILAGGLLSVYLVLTVRNQPASRQSGGPDLVIDLAWAGLVYGMVDAIFLNVLPVLAIEMWAADMGWAATAWGRAGLGALGLLASLLVTLAYHLGYPEFRNKSVGLVLAGNSLITLAFLLSGSPLGSLLSHTAMHVAAVLQGPETTIQLPPHQQAGLKPV